MGNSKSSETNEIVHVNHPYFGEIQIITHQKQRYMKISMVSDGKKAIQEWEKNQELVKDIDVEPLLLPVDYKFEEQGMCGSTGVLHILYENHPVILKDQIQNRRDSPQYFQEAEIWYLLHILVSSAAQFHRQQRKVGDIRPDNIFINQEGHVKIANLCSWPRQQNNYFKSLNDKEQTYLAPEQMNELQKNNTFPETDPYKGQSFSIGLTLLDATTLEDSSKFYNFQNGTFDVSKLQALLSRFHSQQQYSPFLKQVVTDLLHLDPRVRKSVTETYQKILPYEQNIKSLIAFYPNSYQTGKTIVSSYSNTLPGYIKTPYSNTGFTQSIYQNKNNMIFHNISENIRAVPSQPTFQNIISNGIIQNRIITPSNSSNPIPRSSVTNTPTQYISKQYVSSSDGRHYSSIQSTPASNYATTPYRQVSETPATISTTNKLPIQSKQQLWDEIDRQIQRSKIMFQ